MWKLIVTVQLPNFTALHFKWLAKGLECPSGSSWVHEASVLLTEPRSPSSANAPNELTYAGSTAPPMFYPNWGSQWLSHRRAVSVLTFPLNCPSGCCLAQHQHCQYERSPEPEKPSAPLTGILTSSLALSFWRFSLYVTRLYFWQLNIMWSTY